LLAVSSRPAPEPGATRSLRARLAAGPLARRIALIDVRLYRVIRSDDLQVEVAHPVITAYTKSGEHAALWYAYGLAATALDRQNAEQYRRAMLGILATQLVNTAIKGVFRRRRPALEELPALVKVPTSLSFPSAHSATAFAAARAFSALAPSPPLYVAAALMALSRVYVGVHFPSDIAVGAGLGLTIGSIAR
jgi:undecaprenyl-diphosphatase